MADKEIVQLVMLLYDVCKDVLSHLFETRCLNGSLADRILQNYIETHKNRLREHFRKNYCHKCENRNTCIDLTKEAFQSFLITKMEGTKRNQMHVNDLQVWNLQYLLLAGDLNAEEHTLIVGLYNQRNNISKQLTLQLDIDKSQCNEMWETSTNYIIDIYRAMKDASVETVLSNMFEYVKRSSRMKCYAKEVWCNLEAEFGNKDPYPFDLSTEERAKEKKAGTHQPHGIIQIGNNNTVIEGYQKEEIEILAKCVRETNNNVELVIAKLESHDNGIIANTITKETDRDSQGIRLEIDTDEVLTTDEQFENIKRLENTTLNPNDEPIKILKVYKGSIVIEAKVKFCTTDVTFLMKAVREILHHVMEICQVPKEKDFVLRVGIKVGPPYKGIFSQSNKSNTCVKCLKQTFETKGTENRQSDAGTKYGRMVPTPKVQQTQAEDHENRAAFHGYESLNKGEIHTFDKAVIGEMICDYEHYADNAEVAKLKKGDTYYILKEIGNWLEISDGKGGSSFILSEYCKRGANRHIDPYPPVDKNQQTEAPTQVKRIMVKPTERSSIDADVFVEGELIPSGIQSRALPKIRKDTLSETLSSSSETLQVTSHPVARSVSSPDIIHMRDCAVEDSGETKEKSQTGLGRKQPKKGSKIKSDVKTNIKNEPSKWSAAFRAIVSRLEKLLSWRKKRDDLVSEGRIMSTLFGSKLSDVCRRDNLNVPSFVKECIDAIGKRGFDSKNMYNQSNKTAEVVSLRNKIEQGDYDLDSASHKIQELTGILLLFFEELQEPLLPSHFSKILQINESQRTAELKRLLDELPVENSYTLGFFCRHLQRVLEHGQENGTTVQSIVETVAPSLIYTIDTGRRDSKWLSNCEAVSPSTASDILSICLVEYEHIFDETST